MVKASNFVLGLFVTIGILLAAAAILWWGASKYFQKGSPYVTYFDESVQGLQVDSSVKYRGVDVGRVEQIRVAPDNRLIAVVMKIQLKGDVEKDTVAQLKAAGITGIVFVDLDRRSPGEAVLSPELAFTPDYPVIPSRPSQVSQILTGIDAFVENLREVDLKGVSARVQDELREAAAQIRQTGKAMEAFFQGPATRGVLQSLEGAARKAEDTLARVDRILAEGSLERTLARAESAAARLDSGLAKADRILSEGRVESVFAEALGLLGESRDALARITAEVRSLRLGETAEQVRGLAEGLDRKTSNIAYEIRILRENLRRAAERVEEILEEVQSRPADFIFKSPPPLRREE